MKNSQYIRGDIIGPGLHAKIVAEQDDVDRCADRLEEAVQVRQVDLHQLVEERMGLLGLAGQHHHEYVVAVAELTDLEEVAAEQTDDRPLGARAELSGAFTESLVIDGAGGAGNGGPHGPVERFANGSRTVLLGQREVGLLEVQGAVGHLGEDLAVPGSDDPTVRFPLDVGPDGYEARCAVRQCPRGPVVRTQGKTPPHLDRIDPKTFEHILPYDGQLLHDIIDVDRGGGQSQSLSQLRVGQGGDAGRAMAGKVNGDARRLMMIQRRQDTLS